MSSGRNAKSSVFAVRMPFRFSAISVRLGPLGSGRRIRAFLDDAVRVVPPARDRACKTERLSFPRSTQIRLVCLLRPSRRSCAPAEPRSCRWDWTGMLYSELPRFIRLAAGMRTVVESTLSSFSSRPGTVRSPPILASRNIQMELPASPAVKSAGQRKHFQQPFSAAQFPHARIFDRAHNRKPAGCDNPIPRPRLRGFFHCLVLQVLHQSQLQLRRRLSGRLHTADHRQVNAAVPGRR